MSTEANHRPVLESLEVIEIRSPCRMDWDLMSGDEKARHCDRCSKNVYNISAMTNDEAVRLINEKEGEVCVRLYRRRDGTVATAECAPLLSPWTSKKGLRFSMASLILLLTGCSALFASTPWLKKTLMPVYDRWFGTTEGFEVGEIPMNPTGQANPPGQRMMGKVSVSPHANMSSHDSL